VPDPNKTGGFSSYGWTILNVFDHSYNIKYFLFINLYII